MNDTTTMTPIENRIAELRLCPVWADHVSELETLVRETNERAEKAEAEVARLQANLRRSVEIAEATHECWGCCVNLKTELDAIRATLNPETK